MSLFSATNKSNEEIQTEAADVWSSPLDSTTSAGLPPPLLQSVGEVSEQLQAAVLWIADLQEYKELAVEVINEHVDKIAALAKELEDLKQVIEGQRPPLLCRHHQRLRCWYGASGVGCRYAHGPNTGASWRSPGPPAPRTPPPSSPSSPRASRSSPSPSDKSFTVLKASSSLESCFTPTPRSAGTANDVNPDLAVVDALELVKQEDNENEAAAITVIDFMIGKVVQDEEKLFIAAMASKADELENKYEAANKPQEDEEGVTRSPVLPRIGVNFAKVNPFALAKLPKPVAVVVHSCPEDNSFYTKCTAYNHGKDGEKCRQSPETCNTMSYGCFGVLPGFVTNLGVIAPPTEPIYGYVYVAGYGDSTKYALFAEVG